MTGRIVAFNFVDSKRTLMLQLVDIFAGAIGYAHNGHCKAWDASPAKVDLMEHILSRAGITNVFADTAVRGKFTLWHRRLIGVPQP